MNPFSSVPMVPRDPILGLNELFNTDTRLNKINLGAGVYLNEGGNIPLLKSIIEAESVLNSNSYSRAYLPIDGMPSYNKAVQELLLGTRSEVSLKKRIITIQSIGGTGALRIGAELLKKIFPKSKVVISNPSWDNHRTLFQNIGFPVEYYRYYNNDTHRIDVAGMLSDLGSLPRRSIVVLHACCHNPTGSDLSLREWKEVLEAVKENELIPFLDIAYQGLGNGLFEDTESLRLFANSGISFLIASSFSKSFALYGERVGALSVITGSERESLNILSQVKHIIRSTYSNPPIHGAAIISTILNSERLRMLWEEELTVMRVRIQKMRIHISNILSYKIPGHDFSFIRNQCGMFSYTNLSTKQALDIRRNSAIYILDSGRICIACLNYKNIEIVTDAIARVV